MAYTHLTLDDRYNIYEALHRGHTVTEIAASIGRSKSTVSREMRRNRGDRGYRPQQAQRLAQQREGSPRGGRQVSRSTWSACQQLLASGHSPAQTAGRCQREGLGAVSHEFIYRQIYADKASGGSLWRHLRCQKQRRKRYGSGRQRRGSIPNRVGIEARCPRVEARATIGHWEGDTVVGRNHKGFLVTLVERRSGFGLTRCVPSKSAKVVCRAIIEMLRPFRQRVKTLTFDNGLEFSDHRAIADALACKIYFARPYASWQRGTNENYNGLLRQFFPKRSCFLRLTATRVAEVQHLLNQRARKRLAWASPAEVFGSGTAQTAVALAA